MYMCECIYEYVCERVGIFMIAVGSHMFAHTHTYTHTHTHSMINQLVIDDYIAPPTRSSDQKQQQQQHSAFDQAKMVRVCVYMCACTCVCVRVCVCG
jgi:hypothetical protein